MASLNKIMIIGNCGRDPEMRMTPSGKAVASFSVAVNRVYSPGEGGEKREETEWFNVVAWDRLAEICQSYLTKGRQVYVEGRLQTRKWQDREGKERTTVEIVAQQMQMLGGPRDREPAGAAAAPARAAESGESGKFDPDEIPF